MLRTQRTWNDCVLSMMVHLRQLFVVCRTRSRHTFMQVYKHRFTSEMTGASCGYDRPRLRLRCYYMTSDWLLSLYYYYQPVDWQQSSARLWCSCVVSVCLSVRHCLIYVIRNTFASHMLSHFFLCANCAPHIAVAARRDAVLQTHSARFTSVCLQSRCNFYLHYVNKSKQYTTMQQKWKPSGHEN